jgi:hypothetical protein
MQFPRSRLLRVFQNPDVFLPILMRLFRATHSWFNLVESLFGVTTGIQIYTVHTDLPPNEACTSMGWFVVEKDTKKFNPVTIKFVINFAFDCNLCQAQIYNTFLH